MVSRTKSRRSSGTWSIAFHINRANWSRTSTSCRPTSKITRVVAGIVPTSLAKSHTQPGIAGMIALGIGSPSAAAIAAYFAESIPPQE